MSQCLELYVFLMFFFLFTLVLNSLSYINLISRNHNCVKKSTLRKQGTTSVFRAECCSLVLTDRKISLKRFFFLIWDKSTHPISLILALDFNLVEILKKFLGFVLMWFMRAWQASTAFRSLGKRRPWTLWSKSAVAFDKPTLVSGQAIAVADTFPVAINQVESPGNWYIMISVYLGMK